MSLSGELADDRVERIWAHHPALIEQFACPPRCSKLSLELTDPQRSCPQLRRLRAASPGPSTGVDVILGFPTMHRRFTHLELLYEFGGERARSNLLKNHFLVLGRIRERHVVPCPGAPTLATRAQNIGNTPVPSQFRVQSRT